MSSVLCVEMSLVICLSLISYTEIVACPGLRFCKKVHSDNINQDKPFLSANVIFPLATQKATSLPFPLRCIKKRLHGNIPVCT